MGISLGIVVHVFKEVMVLYFDRALEKASETKVMEAFTESLSDMKVYDFELIEYTADDWKTIFCVEHRNKEYFGNGIEMEMG